MVERHCLIAGLPVRLLFAGPVVEATQFPALSHLVIEQHQTPRLTVHLWDSASSGIPAIDLPTAGVANPPPGTWVVHDGPELRWGRQVGIEAVSLLSESHEAAWFWSADATALPLFVRASPLRLLWHWWLPVHSRFLVHAAAIGLPERGVLLAGKGGSGKSTTALACLDSDLLYVADDYVAVSLDPPHAHSLFSSGKMNTDQEWRLSPLGDLPAHRSSGHPFDTDKTVFFLADRFKKSITLGFSLSAILVHRLAPDRADGASIEPAPASAGLLALAPSTILQIPGGGNQQLRALSGLVRSLPTYVLEVGSDPAAAIPVIAKFLEEYRPGAS